MINIFDTLAEKISDLIGFNVVYSNDNEVNDTMRNQTRGVLRLSSTERGLNKELYSERITMSINFVVNLDETNESDFVSIMRAFMNDMQAEYIDLGDGALARLMIGGLSPIGTPQALNGIPFMQYIMDFDCYLAENMVISDKVEIQINGVVLKGVLNYTDSSQYSRDSHIKQATNVPYGASTTKMRAYTIQFIPLAGNEACKTLYNAHRNLSEEALELKVKWPNDVSDEDAFIFHTSNVWITQFDTNLQLGQYGQAKVLLSEYSEVL